MGKNKKASPNQRLFLLSFFDNEAGTKEVNGFILVKYFDNNIHDWLVAIYTKESYQKMQLARDNFSYNSLSWIK